MSANLGGYTMQSTDIVENITVTPSFKDGTKLTAEQKLYLWTG